MKPKSIIETISKHELQKIVDSCDSNREVLTRLGLHPNGGGTSAKLKNRIKNDNINISHFTGKKNNNHKGLLDYVNGIKKPLEEILVLSQKPINTSTKKRILEEGLLKNECCLCGQQPYHNGQILVLQLDHKNGDSFDHRIENLRILCPNCHSQTHNFSGKNRKCSRTKNNCYLCGCECDENVRKCPKCNGETTTIVKTCKICGVEITNQSKGVCKKCYNENRKCGMFNIVGQCKKFDTSTDELQKLIQEMPLIEVGKRYGVSDNAIRKRCKKLGIQIPKFPTGYWLKNKTSV